MVLERLPSLLFLLVSIISPVEKAAHIALETVSQFLKEHTNDFDLVEWVLFDSHTQSVYEAELKKFM